MRQTTDTMAVAILLLLISAVSAELPKDQVEDRTEFPKAPNAKTEQLEFREFVSGKHVAVARLAEFESKSSHVVLEIQRKDASTFRRKIAVSKLSAKDKEYVHNHKDLAQPVEVLGEYWQCLSLEEDVYKCRQLMKQGELTFLREYFIDREHGVRKNRLFKIHSKGRKYAAFGGTEDWRIKPFTLSESDLVFDGTRYYASVDEAKSHAKKTTVASKIDRQD